MKKYVTFDTSWLERTGYDFSFAAFRCIQYTDYQVVISEIVDREITNHLIEKANSFVDSHNSLLRKTKFLSNITKIPKPLNNDKFVEAAIEAYTAFKNTLRAEIIPAKKCNLDSVLEDYFGQKGAFENSGKKSEFPDAIAASSLINFVGNNEIIVFTTDNDWKNVFSNLENAVVYGETIDLLRIIKSEDYEGEVIDDYIENQKEEFEQHIRDSFESYFSNAQTLYPEDYTIGDLDLEDFDFDLSDITCIEVISKNEADNTILTVIHFDYYFVVNVSLDDYSCSTFDKEDGTRYNIMRRRETISGQENGYCFATFSFDSNKFLNIVDCKMGAVDFCYRDPSEYSVEAKPIEEEDYYDSQY